MQITNRIYTYTVCTNFTILRYLIYPITLVYLFVCSVYRSDIQSDSFIASNKSEAANPSHAKEVLKFDHRFFTPVANFFQNVLKIPASLSPSSSSSSGEVNVICHHDFPFLPPVLQESELTLIIELFSLNFI